jgi:hypothetical protein
MLDYCGHHRLYNIVSLAIIRDMLLLCNIYHICICFDVDSTSSRRGSIQVLRRRSYQNKHHHRPPTNASNAMTYVRHGRLDNVAENAPKRCRRLQKGRNSRKKERVQSYVISYEHQNNESTMRHPHMSQGPERATRDVGPYFRES